MKLLIRCPKCGAENWAPMVAKGICCWCGYDSDKEEDDDGYGLRNSNTDNPDDSSNSCLTVDRVCDRQVS